MQKEPIVKNQVYILMKDFMNYYAGDYFRGEERNQLVHVRTGDMWPATKTLMSLVETTGEQFDDNIHGRGAYELAKKCVDDAQRLSQQIESGMPTEKEIFDRIDRDLKRKQRALVIRGIVLLLRFLFETAIIVAVVWLVVKQCNG